MKVLETKLFGCYVLHPERPSDKRGNFTKWFSKEVFEGAALVSNWSETYSSSSFKGVIRGLHFQIPPADHTKMVTCVHGKVLDIILDLRSNSPTFREHIRIDLNSDEPKSIYIPSGCAHGFLSESKQSIVLYHVSSGYSPELDTGIRWDSAGIQWPTSSPIVSARDAALPTLDEFMTPF